MTIQDVIDGLQQWQWMSEATEAAHSEVLTAIKDLSAKIDNILTEIRKPI